MVQTEQTEQSSTRELTRIKPPSKYNVVLLNEPEEIFPEFENAYNTDCSTLLIEWGDYYNEK